MARKEKEISQKDDALVTAQEVHGQELHERGDPPEPGHAEGTGREPYAAQRKYLEDQAVDVGGGPGRSA